MTAPALCTRRDRAIAAAVIAVFLLFGLIGHSPWKPDEAYTFGLVRHIAATADVVVPTLAGEPFMEKPPLYFITAAAALRAFSPPLAPYDAARLASAFYMAIALGFIALAARRAWGPGHGVLAALLASGCLALPIVAHQLITDTALFAGNAIAFYGLTAARDAPRRGGVWMGIGIGIGFMAKGLIMVAFAGVVAAALPLISPVWRTGRYALALALAVLVALPWLLVWPLALHARAPGLFDAWFWQNNWGRFTGASHLGPKSDHLIYLKTLPWYAWPAWPFAAWTWWRGRGAWRTDAVLALPLIVVGGMLLILSAAGDGREIYGLPMLIPLAVLATGSLARLPAWAADVLRWAAIVLFGVLAVLLWSAWIGAFLFHGPSALVHRLALAAPGYVPVLAWPWWVSAVCVTLAWVGLARRRASAVSALLVWTGGLTLIWVLLSSIWLPWFDWTKGYGGMMTQLKQNLPAHYDCIASRGLGEPQRALLEYYAGIDTQRIEVAGSAPCTLLLQQETRPQAEAGAPWKLVWGGTRPGDGREYLRLYTRAESAPAAGRDDHDD